MLKIISWLLLTLLSCAGLGVWFLQQQYEEKSADFRILYREITVKLSQHDAIIPLLPASKNIAEVQRILPQIVALRWHNHPEPRQSVVPGGYGQYWLNSPSISLLVSLNTLLNTLPEKKIFRYLVISRGKTSFFRQGDVSVSCWWRWDKTVASMTQPFLISAGDNPTWSKLPWWQIVSPVPFWTLAFYLLTLFQANRRNRDTADMRVRFTELTRLNTMGELAAGMVHELNQPLTAIMSYNQTAVRLIKQDNTVQVSGLLEASVLQIKRIDALLSQFRHKLINERMVYQFVKLPALWMRVCRLLDNELRAGNVRVSCYFADDLPPLMAPPLWIEQILHNIVSNAIQAQAGNVPDSAWIHLEASQYEHGITLTITDHGPGLTEKALEYVFIPFFTTKVSGIGLGMALVDTLVQRLNGSIEASNIPEQGACFRLWFPAAE
ncbi:sensor histidine kinase [Salmonella enterica]|nr:sensor histidine kinase [Salmonella enterica]